MPHFIRFQLPLNARIAVRAMFSVTEVQLLFPKPDLSRQVREYFIAGLEILVTMSERMGTKSVIKHVSVKCA